MDIGGYHSCVHRAGKFLPNKMDIHRINHFGGEGPIPQDERGCYGFNSYTPLPLAKIIT
jgi:hypothetical protein